MKYRTLLLSTLVVGASLLVEAKDGGNIDFYWKPLCLSWLLVTALIEFEIIKSEKVRIAKNWWVQLLAPITLLLASIGLTFVYKPYAF